jgi:hypothetical protein
MKPVVFGESMRPERMLDAGQVRLRYCFFRFGTRLQEPLVSEFDQYPPQRVDDLPYRSMNRTHRILVSLPDTVPLRAGSC